MVILKLNTLLGVLYLNVLVSIYDCVVSMWYHVGYKMNMNLIV